MDKKTDEAKKKDYSLPVSLFLSAVFVFWAIYAASRDGRTNFLSSDKNSPQDENQPQISSDISSKDDFNLPDGVTLPARWGDLGKKMIAAGVIDAEKFENIYAGRGGLSEDIKALLYAQDNGNLKITQKNSGEILNLLWALGLGNKNEILEDTREMKNPQYNGAGNFASTGGWTLAKGNAMEHYSGHSFIVLNREQQGLVDRVSKGIYRPCCDNSTHFPDCNHGMAMLGLLELMASQGASEAEMYRIALIVNSFWFPEQYATIAKYFSKKGISWNKVDAKEALGINFSSGSGYQRVLSETGPIEKKGGGGGCGV